MKNWETEHSELWQKTHHKAEKNMCTNQYNAVLPSTFHVGYKQRTDENHARIRETPVHEEKAT
jgi:hypothetical protein